MSQMHRRLFIQSSLVATLAGLSKGIPVDAAMLQPSQLSTTGSNKKRPIAIASGNGKVAVERAFSLLESGDDPLDAVIAGVNIVEEDPNDHSVGYGGLPNEDGIVELDASVMHGPTASAGSVAALRNIKTPSKVAQLVRTRTDHVMLVGEGALKFARAHGLEEVNLLTPEAREIWLRWKETHSDNDDWLTPEENDGHANKEARRREIMHTYGTINCLGVTAAGDVGGVTTTSGLSYKLAGRVGDSPIIGAGLFVDNEVGGAGATGRGEAVIQIAGAHTIIEMMRNGKTPAEACLAAAKRIADKTKRKRLLDAKGRPNFQVIFYAVSNDGRHGSASIWSGCTYAVCDSGIGRIEPSGYLYEQEK